jgi:hypothetical protein
MCNFDLNKIAKYLFSYLIRQLLIGALAKMSAIKISISPTSFIVINIISCFPVFADPNYMAIIQKVNARGDRLSADNINKVSSMTNILELADAIGNTIDNQKFLPKISFLLGSISFGKLDKSLKDQGIKSTYSQYSCPMRSQNDLPIKIEASAIQGSNFLPKNILPVLVANRSLLAQGKGSGRSTGQTNKCRYSIVNPTRLNQGDRNLQLTISKQGYMTRVIGFKVIAIEKMQPLLKFGDTNLTLEDERSFRTFEFFIDGGSPELQEQITKQITKKHPRLDRFITNQSVSEILSLENLQKRQRQNNSNAGNASQNRTSSYPDYIVKLNLSQ